MPTPKAMNTYPVWLSTAFEISAAQLNPITEIALACENSRFSSLLAAGEVSRERSPEARSEGKRLFSQSKIGPKSLFVRVNGIPIRRKNFPV